MGICVKCVYAEVFDKSALCTHQLHRKFGPKDYIFGKKNSRYGRCDEFNSKGECNRFEYKHLTPVEKPAIVS